MIDMNVVKDKVKEEVSQLNITKSDIIKMAIGACIGSMIGTVIGALVKEVIVPKELKLIKKASDIIKVIKR